jgi:uncharacterized protein involved in exopolysaccharide biosynthesis
MKITKRQLDRIVERLKLAEVDARLRVRLQEFPLGDAGELLLTIVDRSVVESLVIRRDGVTRLPVKHQQSIRGQTQIEV